MNKTITSWKIITLKIILVLICKLLFGFEMISQNTRIMEPSKLIKSLTEKHLATPCKREIYKETVKYIKVPSFTEPESTISLQCSGDSFLLELIAFRKSLSEQVMKKFIEADTNIVFDTSTHRHSLSISSQLSNKLETLMNNLISSPYIKNETNEVPFDGTYHKFYIFTNGERDLVFHCSQQDTLRTNVINLFSQLSRSIKAGQIDENKIMAIITEYLK